jgi:hypothetical protein
MSDNILLTDGTPFVVSGALIRRVGLEEALVLQQIHYWLRPSRNKNVRDGKHWVHNTYAQWQKQFPFWSVKKIQRIFKTLEREGFLHSVTRHTCWHKTKFYTLNYAKLSPLTTPTTFHAPPLQAPSLQAAGWISPKPDVGKKNGEQLEAHETRLEAPNPTQKPSLRNGSIDDPKMSDGRDKNGLWTGHFWDDGPPKMRCSYESNTEITDRDPPLISPPAVLKTSRQEDEEGKEKTQTDRRQQKPSQNTEAAHAALFDRMVNVWNETVQCQLAPGSQALLTPQRIRRMDRFLKESGVCDLSSWKHYCRRIAQSRFLRGENSSGFRVTLDWALHSINASKILEGAIYDKPQANASSETASSAGFFVEKPWADYVGLLQQHCTNRGDSEHWFRACKVLARCLGQATFEAWFKHMRAEDKGDILALTVPHFSGITSSHTTINLWGGRF